MGWNRNSVFGKAKIMCFCQIIISYKYLKKKNIWFRKEKNIFQIAGVVTITSAILAYLHNPKHSPETEHNLRVIMCNSVYSICSSFLFPHQSHQFVFISWLSGYQGAFSILVENSISQTIMFCIM